MRDINPLNPNPMPVKTKNYATEINEFYTYVIEYYRFETGIYPIATTERIIEACNEYLESTPLSQIHFDSFDRECVREILQPSYEMFPS